jgi:choline dehydrogenase-like flavoprotein
MCPVDWRSPFFNSGTGVPFSVTLGIVMLTGDYQMGTYRMGDDPTQSVVDHFCRLHDAPNVFVVDTSFVPAGMGLNPM